jgi:hypothetical protein
MKLLVRFKSGKFNSRSVLFLQMVEEENLNWEFLVFRQSIIDFFIGKDSFSQRHPRKLIGFTKKLARDKHWLICKGRKLIFIITLTWGLRCGYIPEPEPVEPEEPGIKWKGRNWAFGCDFYDSNFAATETTSQVPVIKSEPFFPTSLTMPILLIKTSLDYLQRRNK